MNYYVHRGGQQYGPYSLADLQRYVAQGNIVPTDLACPEGGTEWVPVSKIIGTAQPAQPQPSSAPIYSQPATVVYLPAGPAGAPGAALPPGLHWAIVLLLSIVTCGLFSAIWIFVQANFVKQIRPASNAIMLYAIGIAGCFGAGLIRPFGGFRSLSMLPLMALIYIGGVVVVIIGHFDMKRWLEEYYNTVEPINLRLNGVLVFFFNVFYFQYYFTRIREWKLTGVWR